MPDAYGVAKQVAGSIYRNQSICFFLGAGAAVDTSLDQDLQLPGGNRIKQELLKTSGIPDENSLKKELKVDTLTPEMVWGKVIQKTKYSNALNLLLPLFEYGKHGIFPIPSTYRFLAKLALSQANNITLMTTNFDEKLEKAFLDEIRIGRESVTPILLTAASDEDFKNLQEDTTGQYPHPILYKLHGTLSRPHTIISTPQQLEPGKKKLLKQVVKRSDVIVFIGYSGSDEGIHKAFRDSLQGVKQATTRHIYWCKHRNESVIHAGMKLFLDNAAAMGFTVDYPENVDSHTFLRDIWIELNEMSTKPITFPAVAEIDKSFCIHRSECYTPKPFERLPDPVHDGIRFTNDVLSSGLCNVVDCAAIQRLRNIKQLSMAYYVFPDATHTRFSHSLGVASLMNAALDGIRNDQSGKELEVDNALMFDCVLTGLLHDIGHGPFGHSVDIFMGRLQRRMKRNHEDFTVEFVKNGLLDLESALGKVPHTRGRVLELLGEAAKSHPQLHALKMLLANKGFDVDRLDFLLRDLYHTGFDISEMKLSKNLYESTARHHLVNTILGNILISGSRKLPAEEQNRGEFAQDATIICFRDGEEIRNSLDDFFKLYIAMYNWVYYRDFNRCAQAMLAKALSFAYDTGEIELRDIHAFTDQELFALLEQSSDNRVRELTKCVKYRYLFDVTEFEPQSRTEAKEVEKRLIESLEVEEKSVDDLVVVDIAPAKAIDDSVYLSDGKNLTRYRFQPEDERLKGEYEKLKKPRGFIFTPQSLGKKASTIRKCLEDSNLS
jgi:HD superfamily phosphohydrolase